MIRDQVQGIRGSMLTMVMMALFLSGCVTEPADPDGWLGDAASIRESNQMNAQGMIPVAIDCRFAPSSSRTSPKYDVRFKYKPNTRKVRGHWQVGDLANIAAHDAIQGKRGYHRVFTKNIYDPGTGNRAACAIWQN